MEWCALDVTEWPRHSFDAHFESAAELALNSHRATQSHS